MNKLLQFYVPKVFIEVATFFGAAAALSLVIKLLPIDDGAKGIFVNFIMYLVLPFAVYFNRKLYLPSSMEWILLTPIKKSHIILAHGLINILKVILVFVLISLFFLASEKYFLFTEIWEVVAKKDSRVSLFIYDNTMGLIGFFGLCTIFIFGILPNYVQSMQDKQNYQVKRTKKELLKRYALAGLGGMIFLGLGADGVVDYIFPEFLKISAAYVAFSVVAVYSTLTSLRFYFSKKKMGGIAVAVFFLFSSYLYIHAVHDFKSNNVSFREKLDAYEYLGAFMGDLDQEIQKELMESGSRVATLKQRDVFLLKAKLSSYPALVEHWAKLCFDNLDYTCRLAYYGQEPKMKSSYLPSLIQTCQNDLGSCLVIYDHKDVPAADQKIALDILTKRCPTRDSDPESPVCDEFGYNKIKKKKKVKR